MPRRAPHPTSRLAPRVASRVDPFQDIPSAAASLHATPRDILRMVQDGKIFALADDAAPFGVVVLRDDLRMLRVASPLAPPA